MGKKWMRNVQRAFEDKAQPTQYFDPDPDLGGDESRERSRAALIEGAEDQIRDYPPVTEAYERLISEGISEFDAKMFIANLLSRAMFDIFKHKREFDEVQYQSWLDRLPELPEDE